MTSTINALHTTDDHHAARHGAQLAQASDRAATGPVRNRMPRALTRNIGKRLALLAPRAASSTVPSRSEASLSHYDKLLTEEARACEVPADLLKAICWFASGWRQSEISGRVLSTPMPAGAGTCWGAMQLSDIWHPDAFPAATTDARANIAYAASLVRWLYEQTGDWNRATIAFFGHDRRAEAAGRRIAAYRRSRPWANRMTAVDTAPTSAGFDASQGAAATVTVLPRAVTETIVEVSPVSDTRAEAIEWSDLTVPIHGIDDADVDVDTSTLYDDLAV